MIRRLIVASIIFGIAPLVVLSVGVRSFFAFDNAVIDENDRVVLHGNIHSEARRQFDVGPTDPSLPMKRIILPLKIDREKQARLDRLVAEQKDPTSPNFHQWLTPEEFGKKFGRSPEDIATVKSWLITHGFTIDETGKAGTWINFSGTAAEVEHAFHTTMRDYRVEGHLRHANSTAPSIPRALADLVAGPVSLHSFPHKPMHTPPRSMPRAKPRPVPKASPRPDYTESDGSHDLAPGDFATIYDVNNVYNLGYNGAGVTIGIVGRTHPDSTKWNTFRSTFGLSYNPPIVTTNGTDPGDLGGDEDYEADLDVEWSGAVATGATINFVVSASTESTDGADLSAQYIVDSNQDAILSDCFGLCEPDLGLAGNSFYNLLWEQAASQGISVFVASGDTGSYTCVDQNGDPLPGLAVNGLASTPYNTAVGGTSLSNASTYWNPANGPDGVSALGYIPEVAWNNYGQGYDNASGGGASAFSSKPAWQVCPGVPNDGARDLPDVSLDADPYFGYRVFTCTSETGSCTSNTWIIIGGTSASTVPFAGIAALLVQNAGGQRQGNVNSTLYQLGSAQYSGAGGASPVFNDITSGNNGFGSQLPGYSCTPYYDLVTGLGSVNVTNLFLVFQETGSLTVTISPDGAVSAGALWNVNGGSWQGSGTTVSGLTVGSHTVAFNTIPGWNTPAAQTVTIANGQTTPAGGLYIQQTGSLTVTISPADAVSAGALWNVDGGSWQGSGTTFSGLTVGSHTVAFNTIPGWNTPAPQTVTIANGQTTPAGGLYVLQTGSLTVTIGPADAVSAGALWNVDGGSWQGSGTTFSGLTVGSHTLAFNTVTGWNTPAPQTVTIANGQTTPAGGTYVQQVFTVTPSAGAGGSISPSAAQQVDYGGTTSFSVTPNTGYGITSVTGCGGTPSGSTNTSAPISYQTGPITADCSVTATFANYPVIRISAGTGAVTNYTSLQAAYNDASNGDAIECQSGTLSDTSFTSGDNVSVTINGGYKSDYSSVTGVTTFSGNAAINSGNVTWMNFDISK